MRAEIPPDSARAPFSDGTTRTWLFAGLGALLLGVQTGCTALLGSSGLQDMLPETGDAAAIAAYATDESETDGSEVETNEPVEEQDPPAPDPDDAFEAAIERLDESGRLDDATRMALETALRDAPRQDWPPIIDAFVATIETAPRPQRTAMRPVAVQRAPEPPAEKESLSETPQAKEAAPATPPTAAPAPVAKKLVASAPEPEPEPPPVLAIANACFATRVKGWGAVDRFADTRFLAAQEFIVYFELEHLASAATAEGHTTRIDTTLQLIAADGRRLHEWRFEPVEETCPAPRRDYFARYVLRIPDDVPPGPCRLDVAVTDTVGRCTAATSLPLEIVGR